MSNIRPREVMILQNLFYCSPLVESCFAYNSFALGAEIVNLGLIRTADSAKVFKVYVDDELFRNDLVLVLSDVFRTELHLACLDVVSSLDEGSVEHDPEHDFVRPASLRHENDLYIALQHALFLLLLCHQEDHPVLSLAVVLLSWTSELPSYVQASATKHLEVRLAATMRYVRHLHKLDSSELLRAGRLYFTSIEGLKVVQIAQLAGLTDAFTAGEALVSEKSEAIVHIIEVAHEKQDCADGRPCATLARVAMDDEHVFRVRC